MIGVRYEHSITQRIYMAKYTPTSVKAGFNLNSINDNFTKIATELNDKVLYRNNPTGEANQLESQLDANSNRIINLRDAVSAKEPVTLSQMLAFVIAQAPEGGSVVVETTGSAGTTDNTVFNLNTLFGITATSVLDVWVDGVHQFPATDYSFTANIITISESLADGDRLRIRAVV